MVNGEIRERGVREGREGEKKCERESEREREREGGGGGGGGGRKRRSRSSEAGEVWGLWRRGSWTDDG